MRTTLTLDHDIMEKVRQVCFERGQSFKAIVNEALRAGLSQLTRASRRKPYRTVPHAMGLRKGYSLDNVSELLAQLEGEDSR